MHQPGEADLSTSASAAVGPRSALAKVGRVGRHTPAGVAQLVEQLIRNQQVLGSSPSAGSRFLKQIGEFRAVSEGRHPSDTQVDILAGVIGAFTTQVGRVRRGNAMGRIIRTSEAICGS